MKNPLFELNLCRALAHTLVLDQHLPGIPAGHFRNNMDYSPPSPGSSLASSLRGLNNAMRGTGRFAKIGKLPDLMAEYQPILTGLSLSNIRDYLAGVNGMPGMLDMYSSLIQPALSNVESTQRAHDIADVQTLGPKAYQALREFNPAATGLLDTMTANAQRDLNLNGALDPFTKTMLAQDYRSGAAARGLGTGYNDAAAEAYYQDATRHQRKLEADQAGQVAVRQNALYYGDPFMQILNRSSSAPAMNSFAQGAGGAAGANSLISNAMMPIGASQIYGAQNQANAYGAQAQSDLMGGLFSGFLGLGGATMGAAGQAGGFGKLFSLKTK